MENKNNLIPVILIFIIAVSAVGLIIYNKTFRTSQNNYNDISDITVEGIVLYYSLTCPHCKNVEDFIAQNNIKNKVSFTEKEVSGNQSNADEMLALAKKCGISAGSVGVPFLWDGNKCLIGDQDIINFFKTMAGNN